MARTTTLTPSEVGANDGAALSLTCGTTSWHVSCDGENDGTGTSLCECYRDGQEVRIAGNPWPGEGIGVAYGVAERCRAAK